MTIGDNERLFSHKVNIVSGMIATSISNTVFLPMDLIKIKMQQQTVPISGIATASQIYRADGIKGFFKGALFPFMTMGSVGTVRLYVYRYFQQLDRNFDFMKTREIRVPITAVAIGLIGSLGITPIELIRIKTVSPEYRDRFSGSISVLKHLWREHGMKGLQRGLAWSFLRDTIFQGVFIYNYERIKQHFGQSKALGFFLASAIAPPIAWCFAFPIDTVKTIVQADDLRSPKWTGRRYLAHLYKAGRLASLYHGLPATLFRSAINSPIFLVSWEISLILLQRLEDNYHL